LGKCLTFDCLLKCIDGVELLEGVFVIITTNDLEKVHTALGGGSGPTRPGRVDRVYEFPLLDKAAQSRLARRILSDHPEVQPEAVAQLGDRVSRTVATDAFRMLAEELFYRAENHFVIERLGYTDASFSDPMALVRGRDEVIGNDFDSVVVVQSPYSEMLSGVGEGLARATCRPVVSEMDGSELGHDIGNRVWQ
jgi:hypothetical protein